MQFNKQRFIAWQKNSAYYATVSLCSMLPGLKLFQLNWRIPKTEAASISMCIFPATNIISHGTIVPWTHTVFSSNQYSFLAILLLHLDLCIPAALYYKSVITQPYKAVFDFVNISPLGLWSSGANKIDKNLMFVLAWWLITWVGYQSSN